LGDVRPPSFSLRLFFPSSTLGANTLHQYKFFRRILFVRRLYNEFLTLPLFPFFLLTCGSPRLRFPFFTWSPGWLSDRVGNRDVLFLRTSPQLLLPLVHYTRFGFVLCPCPPTSLFSFQLSLSFPSPWTERGAKSFTSNVFLSPPPCSDVLDRPCSLLALPTQDWGTFFFSRYSSSRFPVVTRPSFSFPPICSYYFRFLLPNLRRQASIATTSSLLVGE